jgi:uncharacterized UPF0160 family protein
MTINLNEITDLYTHAGTFHADESFATAMLMKITNVDFKNLHRVNQGSDVENVNTETSLIYDIGGGQFDHHQQGRNGKRENGVYYASAGLIWREFGLKIVGGNQEVVDIVDNELIQGIDLQDNGDLENQNEAMTVSEAISEFNPRWNSNESQDAQFELAVNFASQVLTNAIENAKSLVKAADIVKEELPKVEDGVLVFDTFLPYQQTLFDLHDESVLVVVYPSNRGGYNWQVTSVRPGSFDSKVLAPESWRGLRDEELQEKSGIQTAFFVHNAGFIGGATSLEDTIKMAHIVANNI